MAAGNTYTPIATTTLGSNQTSVTFSSLGSYTDIVVIANVTGNDGAICMRFNSDSSALYSYTGLRGNGSAGASSRVTGATYIGSQSNLSVTAGTLQTSIWNVQNYRNSTTYKTVVARDGMTTHQLGATVGLWRSYSAITSISLAPEFSSNVFYTGSTFTLYGITAA